MDKTVYELLLGDCGLDACIYQDVQENLDVMPSDMNLAAAEIELRCEEQGISSSHGTQEDFGFL